MALNSCVFAVQLADEAERPEVERRIELLARFYAPLGDTAAATRYVPAARALVGEIRFDGERPNAERDLIVWGGPLPERLATARGLIAASDDELRAIDSVVAGVALGAEGVRLVAGAGLTTTLYGAGDRAWATHAVAAAWLATGEQPRIAPLALAELLACEFVGDERTLLVGVRALPVATVVDIGPGAARERCFWPAAERWRPLPEGDAYAHAERALLDGLAPRARSSATYVGLTGGLDSRVVARALVEREVSFRAFTWGDPQWGDVAGAADVADALAIERRRQPVDWQDDDAALARLDGDVRWTEAAIQVSFARPTWPAELGAFVTGGGGEIGRCFYYRHRAGTYREPSDDVLARGLFFESRLERAHPEAIRHVRERTRAWIADAGASGQRGWARLDVMYGEQRVRRWGRGMLSRQPQHFVPAFATPEVGRALASLPTASKAVDGFHRRFLETHAPALAPAAAEPVGAPHPLRSQARRVLAPLARPAVAAVRRRRAPPPQRWWAADLWSDHARFRDFLVDDVLTSRVLDEAVGAGWVQHVRQGLLAGHAVATELTLLAAAAHALDGAMSELQPAQTAAERA